MLVERKLRYVQAQLLSSDVSLRSSSSVTRTQTSSRILQISSNFALARSLSANQGREIAQNRNIDPRDSVVKDLTATGAMLARLSLGSLGRGLPAVTWQIYVGSHRVCTGSLRVNCLPNHFLSTFDPPMASWFSSCL